MLTVALVVVAWLLLDAAIVVVLWPERGTW